MPFYEIWAVLFKERVCFVLLQQRLVSLIIFDRRLVQVSLFKELPRAQAALKPTSFNPEQREAFTRAGTQNPG